MEGKPTQYIILEDAYYVALDISENVKRLRPSYRLLEICDEASEAIQAINTRHPDMLIANTTVGDGDAISILQNASVKIPVIFFSEYEQQAARADALNMVDFILKPVTPHALECALERFDAQEKVFNK